MEPKDDIQLRKLLREWKVEDAPPSLDERVLGARTSWWSFLIKGSMRVPVPLALAFAVALVIMGVALIRPRTLPIAPATPSEQGAPAGVAAFQPVDSIQVRIIGGTHAR